MTARRATEASPAHVASILTAELGSALAEDLRGVIAHGSWIHGDFAPGRSDVDLLVLLRSEPGADHLERVQPVLDDAVAAAPEWRDRLELGFTTRAAIEHVVGDGATDHRSARVSPGEPLHLIATDRHRVLDWDAAHRGRSLLGGQASQLVPAVPDNLVVDVVREHVRAWPHWVAGVEEAGSAAVGYAAYAVLTAGRGHALLTTGRRLSKREAAGHLCRTFPEQQAITGWAERWWYSGGSATEAPPAGVELLVTRVSRHGLQALNRSHP